uniref:tRNA(Ile)-lysidine synthase, chloroplastic n=1 Tax=Polysiphonia scopulorum TaxID=257860 RepID=A0A1Z1MHN4_9FLOR|nr:tRNA Ile-lysidine synthetase [Polysiphonia scopulorum]ARW65533.1 tRNA Ile-lysidine synthetase [Polysiphonia scopulorum]
MIKSQISKIIHSLAQLIKQKHMNQILVAFSGGQDSILLVYLLENFIKNNRANKIKVSYIYIDHQWKTNSYEQIKHIIKYLKLTLNKIYIYQIKTNILSEDICRKYRGHIITQHAIEYKNEIIITGHNLTDKVETFIHHTIRGSSIESFNSLSIESKVKKNITIFRPLINIDREAIYWICKKLYLPIWSDVTNYLFNIERNRIRQELVPYIKKYMSQNIEKNISYLINNYLYENDYIKQNVIKLYIQSISTNKIAINYILLKKQNIILQMRTIQLFCFHNFQIYISHNKIMNMIKKIRYIITQPITIYKEQFFRFVTNKKWIYVILD